VRNHTALPIVCFDDPAVGHDRSPAHLHAILDAVVAGGTAWLSQVALDGRPALRACITSYRTSEDTIASLRRQLVAARSDARATT